jgi:cell division protein FtsI/penicillin-binding protein 2
MRRTVQLRRWLLLVLAPAAVFAGLAFRLVELQVWRHAELRAKAEQNTRREILREPRRGDILDARGNLLATSVFVKTVCADPVLVGRYPAELARALAPLLQTEQGELYQRLLPRLRQNARGETVTNRYVVLKRKVPAETWEQVRAAVQRLGAAPEGRKLSRSEEIELRNLRASVFTDPLDDQQRVYPNGMLAAQVLGFVGMEECELDGMPILQTRGVEGIEAALDSKLTGVPGWRVTEKDRRGREVLSLRDQDVEPRDGFNVVLTLDAVVQHIVEDALAQAMERHSPLSASALVVRPRTGEILAMATLPAFDPNRPGAFPPEARRNRVITDIMEPGSTFKIVVVAAALNDRLVSLSDTFDCEHGHFAFGGRVLHDHESYGVLTVQSIITKSSNIGAAKIGIRLGPQRLYDYMRAFGFGQKTGVPLLSEQAGIVSEPAKWFKISLAQIPMGHGIAVTRLQMAMAMAALANGGVLMRPMLVARLEDRQGNVVARYAPQPVRRVVSETAAKLTVEALKTVVSPEGTAPKAALEHYTVAGKTGTAQKPGPGGYLPGKYIASFIGFFPADQPEVCISVVLDEPKQGYYGGQVAAPIFKQIAERVANYLNIRPDRNDAEPPAERTVASGPERLAHRADFTRNTNNP